MAHGASLRLGVVVAPVLGPTLGGWLTDTYSWRWAFYINIPIGILAILMIMRFVEDPPYIKNAKPGRFDRYRPRTAGGLARRAADHPRQRPGRRLVRRHLDSLDDLLLVVSFVSFLIRELTHDKHRWWTCVSSDTETF